MTATLVLYLGLSIGVTDGLLLPVGRHINLDGSVVERYEAESGPVAQVEAGFQMGRWELFLQHTSDPTTNRDHGYNIIGLRGRISTSID